MSTSLRTAAATLLAFLALAATAWAYLGATGSGSGSGSVTAEPVRISAGTSSPTLLPTGAPTGTVVVKLTNTSSETVRVTSLEATGYEVAGGSPASCDVTFAKQTAGWDVPADSTRTVTFENTATMATTAPDACQGKTIRVLLKST